MPYLWGLLGGLGLATVLLRLGAVTLGGAGAGALLVAWFFGRDGAAGLLGFGMFVLVGTALSRLPRESRREHEPRTAWQALANAGVAAVCLVLPIGDAGRVLAFAALGCALSDTTSTEIGERYGNAPRMLLFGPRVRAGCDGGMTWFGTAAGLLAALAMALLYAAFGGPLMGGVAVALGGISGNVIDSLLGVGLENRLVRRLSPAAANDVVNFLATAGAAGVAGLALALYGAVS